MMDSFRNYFAVGLGSALGGMGRLWVSNVIARRFGETFPWGTLVVNITGSFAIGLIAALAEPAGRSPAQQRLALFFATGICGGYTTFSAFSLQTLRLVRDGQWWQAGGNIVLSLALCLAAVLAGYLAGQSIQR